MSFSLFECQDGTLIVVPRGLTPPLAAYKAHGEFVHLSDECQHLYDTALWDEISREVDRTLYKVVQPEVALRIFDVPDRQRTD
ncbi:hypothetical protein FZO89_04270 [Luteimonas viscosa]|uniref:Uncharacterized protein n=1 Tax=Luteimonas viscosa TaxID=1132694 RepID=A0A5D4XLU8_9GAMM|nr:hypothetical protein [Luteimonas viscosa]TYT25539.1 hypothetical protein FZO89_04270 [Luteimonas viscosa]